ncbi:hypothetical protein SAMN05421759_10574 [Roseivivax lentus]|uniref:Uncharacterized protein n=1 Tax=Roseivivax lentus TaxID=633194 RepID=A0A1N7MPW8_9RHOB|nr:hypothetical protein [Roseivivax lentus]SIS88196.1 hypothetical protein SAMN05421759_10574 [Roseivivax lentus]
MGERNKKNAWMGLVGGVGVVAAIGGFVGGWYAPGTTMTLSLGIWIIGAMLVRVLLD